MNVFDTLFPRRTARAQNTSVVRPTDSRRRLAALRAAENLENRLAFAVITAFQPRFQVDVTGDITIAANTLMTAPPSGGADAIAAQNGTAFTNNDNWGQGGKPGMAYVDQDGTAFPTFNSSQADLVLPSPSATVLFAGLYWGGRTSTLAGQRPTDAELKTVKFMEVGDASYTTFTAGTGTNDFSRVIGGVDNRSNVQTYRCFADVTAFVANKGAGAYRAADVQAQDDTFNTFAGWSLVVVYSAPGAPGEVPRNLVVFDGFADVNNNSPADRSVSISFSGFKTPTSGSVDATLGFVTFEGDLGISGDQAFFKSATGPQTLLGDAVHPTTNFFNSVISNRGSYVTSKSPNYVNQLGFDATLIAANGIIQNGDSSATVTVTSNQDQYYPSVITTSCELYAPAITIQKQVTDLTPSDPVQPGDTLRYTITVSNAAGDSDAATNVVVNDLIPANTTYKTGTLTIDGVTQTGTPPNNRANTIGSPVSGVQFRLGTGASLTAGGTLAVGASTTATFEVTVNADIPNFPVGINITNTATVNYTGATLKISDSRSSSISIFCPPLTGDLSIRKTTTSSPVIAGQSLTYTLIVTNSGPSTATNALVTDTFPTVLLNPTWTAVYSGGASGATSGSNTINTLVTVPKNATATFTITGTVDPSTAATAFSNTATVTPPNNFIDTVPTNNASTVNSTCIRQGDLSITKTASNNPVVAGQTLTYTLTVNNTGVSQATNASVTDTFPTVLLNPSWTAVYSGNATGNASGTGTINQFVTVPTGGQIVYTVTGTVDPSSAADAFTNTATVTGSSNFTDTNTNNNASTVTTDVTGRQADLSISKTPPTTPPSQTTYTPGVNVTYTIIVSNLGPNPIPGTIATDPLPTGTTFVGATGGASYDGGTNTVTFNVGPLAVNGTQTYTLTILPGVIPGSDLINKATVAVPAGFVDPNPLNNTATSVLFELQPPASIEGGLVIGTDDGCNGRTDTRVRVIDALNDGAELLSFVPYPGWKGSVRVATGDVNGDGIQEIITAPGRNRVGEIRVFDSTTGVELQAYRTFPFGPKYRGGVEVAVGNLNTDIYGDIIAGMSSGAGMVSGFLVSDPLSLDPVANSPYRSFRGFPGPYSGGVKLAAADFGSYVGSTWTPGVFDGISEIVVGSNAGIRATVKVVDVSGTPKTVRTILPFAANFRGGVTLATGRYNLDDVPDIFVGAGVGGKSALEVWSITGGAPAKLAVFAGMAKQNATLFTAPLDTTGTGIVTNIYGVQGLNGGGGTKGVRGYQVGTPGTATTLPLTNNANFSPPLRIAPLRLPPLGLRRTPR
jgi:uncharacterized repeat protein (TIGR01451 family)